MMDTKKILKYYCFNKQIYLKMINNRLNKKKLLQKQKKNNNL